MFTLDETLCLKEYYEIVYGSPPFIGILPHFTVTSRCRFLYRNNAFSSQEYVCNINSLLNPEQYLSVQTVYINETWDHIRAGFIPLAAAYIILPYIGKREILHKYGTLYNNITGRLSEVSFISPCWIHSESIDLGFNYVQW